MKKFSFPFLVVLILALILTAACTNTAATTSASATATTAAPTTTAASPTLTSTSPTTTAASPVVTATPSPSITGGKVATIRLVGTIGPLTIPLAYMQQNNVLSSIADQTTLTLWQTPTQLQAIITGGQGDFIELPTNSAATFYNKGINLKALDASIWNILYLVTPDSTIKSITDLKGKTIVVPYQNAIPDAMVQYVLEKNGLTPDTDVTILYTPDPIQATQQLLSGQQSYVWLSEPSATSAILKGQSAGTTYYRALNMKTEYEKITMGDTSTPIAGTVVLGSLSNRPDIIQVFNTEYQKAIQWMLANPVEAGNVGAQALAEQGFTANVLTESMNNIDWRYVSAQDARADMEAFFNALSTVSPNFIGGKLPDDGFYYKP